MTETNNNRTSNQAPTIQDYASQVVRSARPRWERELLKSWLTTMVVPLERRKARAILRSRNQARLHLGCASNYLDGWTNIDLFRPGRRLDLRWDLRRGIPAPDDCAESILAEHLLEHIDLGGGIGLLKECYRVLRSGGVLRIGVPDLERYVRSYLCDDPLIDRVRPGRPTRESRFVSHSSGTGTGQCTTSRHWNFSCERPGFSRWSGPSPARAGFSHRQIVQIGSKRRST